MHPLHDHLELELAKHADRSYLAKLTTISQPHFVSTLFAEVASETKFWMSLLATDEKTFLDAFQGNQYAFQALRREHNALKDIEQAIALHDNRAWAEASTRYCAALSNLYAATSDWHSALHEFADASPFDPYCPTAEQRAKYHLDEPARASYEDMCQIAPSLYRIYRNLDRLFVIGLEVTQRQMTCLAAHMQALEEQYVASRNESAPIQAGDA